MILTNGILNDTYIIAKILAKHKDISDFLFSLGFYPGEKITIISKLASNYIVNIKDARYSIDENLAKAIIVQN